MLRVVEETSHSQSECETEDSSSSPDKHSAAECSAVKATRDEPQSDDSTDVEDSEASKRNVVHAGDGDKADGMLLTVGYVAVQLICGRL